MRRSIAILVVVGLIMVVLATGALAASPYAGCPVGPSGTGGSTIGGWELWDEATPADALVGRWSWIRRRRRRTSRQVR